MAVAGVGQEIVGTQTAILSGALLDNCGSHRGRLGQRDRSRANERQGIPEIVRRPVSYVHKGRARDNAVVLARELQSLVHGRSAAA